LSLKAKKILFFLSVTVLFTSIIIIADSYRRLSAQSQDECFACHEDKDLSMDKGGKKVSLFVDPKSYKNSVHSIAECVDCHEKYKPDDVPHTKTKQSVNCLGCHKEAAPVETSIHGSVKCYECHSKHEVMPAKELAKNPDKTCLSCHKTKNVQQYTESIHGKKNIGCKGCHDTGHKVKKISKKDVADVCGKCHGGHEKDFQNSIHTTVMNKGNKNAPTCTDCHGSHIITRNKMSVESQACLRCHLDETKFPGDKQGSARFVAHYKTSIHAAIEKEGKTEAAGCIDCHGDHMIQNSTNPQSSTMQARQMETCGKCHKDVLEHFKKSKHGQELVNKNVNAPVCSDCHGEHDIQAVLSSDQFSKLNLTDKCLTCHKDSKIPHKNYKGEEELIRDYKESQHYQALQKGNQNAPTCYDCHGAHEMEKADQPDSKINRKNIAKTCGRSECHSGQLKEYTGSIHEKAISEKGSEDSPTCNNCHGNHVISTKKRDVKLTQAKEVIQLCSNCHGSVEMVRRNDLPTKVTQTYNESFHGLATRGGSSEVANCESCHGNHNIRPSNDPLSTINKNNLPVTCGKCHPGATEALFTTKIHLNDPEKDSPWVYWISKFYVSFIVGLIGFMIIHNSLDVFRKLKRRKKK
jgi:predicted CXXCH cytochrome family protein